MIPKPRKMHKWFDDKAELKEGDVIYFKKVDSNTDRAVRSVHEFEEYEQDMPDTLPLVKNKLMLLFCPVNTDFTDMETEPDASVDSSF